MKTPIIGISGSVDTEETKQFILRDYMQAVLYAGGIPVLLSMDMDDNQMERCVDALDGLLLAGGNDISPALYAEDPLEALGEVSPLRDGFEMPLIRLAYSANMPVLGICRGIQAMTVALGGRLYQALSSQICAMGQRTAMHKQAEPYSKPCHSVTIKRGTLLYECIQADSIDVNSMHHQAVREILPKNMSVNALSPDNVIEGVEAPERTFFMGVQWHPERMYKTSEPAYALFKAFTAACAAHK